MRSCTSCTGLSSCSELCDRVESAISHDYVSQRELTIEKIEFVSSSAAFRPDNSAFPVFKSLKPIENYCLEKFYADGMSYAEIAEKLNCKHNFVKITLARAKQKIRSESEFS